MTATDSNLFQAPFRAGIRIDAYQMEPVTRVAQPVLIDPGYADPMRAWLGPLRPGSLLILDEAHHAAPSSGGRYGIESKFTRAVRDLAGRFDDAPPVEYPHTTAGSIGAPHLRMD